MVSYAYVQPFAVSVAVVKLFTAHKNKLNAREHMPARCYQHIMWFHIQPMLSLLLM